jgi:hypothetical protein
VEHTQTCSPPQRAFRASWNISLSKLRAALGQPINRRHIRSLGFWSLVILLLVSALISRIDTSLYVKFPYWTPDSQSYVEPSMKHPLLAFSEIRTIGVPLIVSLSIGLFDHPVGVLLIHNALWLISTLALVISLVRRLGNRLIAMAMLLVLCYLQKNLSYELMMMSEHCARCLYCLWAALLISGWGRFNRTRILLIALVTAANIFVKPTAMVLLPATVVALLTSQRSEPERRVAAAVSLCIVFLSTIGLLIAGYLVMYKHRFGYFGLLGTVGHNLYAHVAHLTNLESDRYPEVMARLRRIMPAYFREHSARDEYLGDWVLYGSLRDKQHHIYFGDDYPGRIVREYAATTAGPQSQVKREQKVFFFLAFDAIRAHPGGYLRHVIASAWRLVHRGWTSEFHIYMYPKDSIDGWCRLLLQHNRSCALPGWLSDNQESSDVMQGFTYLNVALVVLVSAAYRACIWVLPWLAILLLPQLRKSEARHNAGIYWALLTATAGFVMSHALIIVSEPGRFFASMQDLAFLLLLLVLSAELGWLRSWLAQVSPRFSR